MNWFAWRWRHNVIWWWEGLRARFPGSEGHLPG